GLRPQYGLWRRVDSCVADALLCWPEIELTGPVPGSMASHAGWANGAWSSDLRRIVHRGDDFGFNPPDGQWDRPYVEPLHAAAPVWRFVDAPQMRDQTDLDGIEEVSPGQFLLPQDTPLASALSGTPHLVCSDGRSVIFPSGRRRTRGVADNADAWFLYADDDA